jgi:putative endonuclease
MERKKLNREIGALGEESAERFLRKEGYRVLARNYRCKAGEIDIIAEDRGTIVFVEVKTRSPRAKLAPEEAVDAAKREHLRRAAKFYLASYREPSPTRFDIVSVWLDARDAVTEIRLDTDAFHG